MKQTNQLSRVLVILATILAVTSCSRHNARDAQPSQWKARLADSIAACDTDDPFQDVHRAVKEGDQQFWGIGGAGAITYPGVPDAQQPRAQDYKYKHFDGLMADVIPHPDDLADEEFARLWKLSWDYVTEYNRLLAAQLAKNPKAEPDGATNHE